MGGIVFAFCFLVLAFALFFVAVGIELTTRRKLGRGIQREVARIKRIEKQDEL